MPRHRNCKCEAARLKTSSRIPAFLLQERIWMALAPQHRRPAFAKRYRRHIREHSAIAPHSRPWRFGCVRRNRISNGLSSLPGKAITNVQRSRAVRAKRLRLIWIDALFATRTFEMADFRHLRTIAVRGTCRQVTAQTISTAFFCTPRFADRILSYYVASCFQSCRCEAILEQVALQ